MTPVPPAGKLDGRLVLSHQGVPARVVFHCFTVRKLCSTQARKILVLLPDVMEALQDYSADAKVKALVFLRNMMGHMKRKEASLMALQLAEKLLPLVDDVRLPWGPKPCRRALCTDSSLQPSPVGSTRAGLPSRSPGLAFQGAGALQLWLHICPTAPAFRARLQSMSPHISHANALAHRGQGAAVVEVPLSSSLPGVQPGAGALHRPLQRPDEDCGGEENEKDEEDSAEGPAPAVPPYE